MVERDSFIESAPAVTPEIDLQPGLLRTLWLPALLLTLAVWLPYGHSVSNGLMFDDRDTILHNTAIEAPGNLSLLFSRLQYFESFDEFSYRPVVTLSYFIDCAIAGKQAWIYHLHNVLLHNLNVLLVLLLLVLIGAGRWEAFAVALVFALHPLQSEAVIFPGFREDLQMTAGLLAMSCALAIDRDRPRAAWVVLASAALAWALLAKEAALLVPVAWLVFDIIRNATVWRKVGLARRYIPIAVVLILYVLVRFIVMANPQTEGVEGVEPLPLDVRIWTAPHLFAYYLGRFLWPMPLSIVHEVEPIRAAGPAFYKALTICGLFLLLWVMLSLRRPWLWLAGLWAGATFLPVSNLYPIANYWAERFYYAVNIGTAAVAVAAVSAAFVFVGPRIADPHRRKVALAGWVLAGGLIWLAAMYDFVRVLESRTPLALWRSTVRVVPESGVALRNLALREINEKNYARGEELARKAENLEGGGTYAANYILGLSAYSQGQWKRAIDYFEKARPIEPPSVENQVNLLRMQADCFVKLNQERTALLRLGEALEWDPNDAVAQQMMEHIQQSLEKRESPAEDRLTSPTAGLPNR
jgi:tetratricopeptide (TPR) repeat protein